jgi:hypothetical protein
MAKAMTKQLPADAPDLYQFVGVDSTNSAANSSEIHAANDSVVPNSSLANTWLHDVAKAYRARRGL